MKTTYWVLGVVLVVVIVGFVVVAVVHHQNAMQGSSGQSGYGAVGQTGGGGTSSDSGSTGGGSGAGNGNAPSGNFNILSTNSNSFSTANLSGLPSVNGLPSVGYQDGALVDGKMVYFPWQITSTGSTWISHIQNGVAQSVMVEYNESAGINGFNNANNWSMFDLSTLPYAEKGVTQPGNKEPNVPQGFMGGTVVGNIIYPTPNGHHPYPVFVAYDASKPFTAASSYQTFTPPPMGGALGTQYGWCSATNDGRYVYYAPLSNPINGNSGNIFRYDTTKPFNDISSWSAFNMGTQVAATARSFQSATYDGNRYIYYIPFHDTLIVRYDTWGGGTGPNPAAFTNPASYKTLDPTKLNSAGYPTAVGNGNPANLAGFTGVAVAWDSAHQNEYMYLEPWGTFPGNATGGSATGAQTPVLQSTVARVRIGTESGSNWSPVDITSTNAPSASAPDWEIFDINSLTSNPAWPASWPKTYSTGPFAGESTIAGWQIAYVITSPTPMVGFFADASRFFVQQDVDKSLNDPSSWYVGPVPAGYRNGNMGGAYDPSTQTLYPSSPSVPLYAVQFK
jgi:hypothetical protein